MGLNDENGAFFTLGGDSAEASAHKVKVDVFKPTTPGDVPEIRDNVEFIMIPQDPAFDDSDEQNMNTTNALESACVRLRDLDLLVGQIHSQGGMSQSVAVENATVLPALITASHPKEFYTNFPSKTSLSFALEAVDQERGSILARMGAAMKAFFDRFVGWFKTFVSRFNGKKAAEQQAAADQAAAAKREEEEKRIQALHDEIEHLRRAANSTDEEFKAQLAARDEKLAAADAKIMDLTTQMRVLDDTKSREIAAALDQIDKLRRSSEASREKRISLQEQVAKLEVMVKRAMVRESFELIKNQERDILADYRTWCANNVLKQPGLSKYLFGNGFQNRLQTIKRVTDAVLAGAALIEHLKKLTSAFEQSVNDPQALMGVIGEIDFSHFSTADQVFQKTEGFEKEAQSVSPRQYKEAFAQMREEFKKVSAAMGGVKFEDLIASMEKLSKAAAGDMQVPVNTPNLTEIANSHRATQAHVAKLLQFLHKGAISMAEIVKVWGTLNAAEPTVGGYLHSTEGAARVKTITDAAARSVSVMESFAYQNLNQEVREIMSTMIYAEGNK